MQKAPASLVSEFCDDSMEREKEGAPFLARPLREKWGFVAAYPESDSGGPF